MPATPGVPSRDMFSWFRKAPRPPRPAAENPGRGHTVRVAFANAQKSWEEKDDLAASLATTLNALGHEATVKRRLGGTRRRILVGAAGRERRAHGRRRREYRHHDPDVARGAHAQRIFEFQHSSGTDVRDSFAKASRAGRSSICRCSSMRCEQSPRRAWSWKWQGQESKSLLAQDRRLVFGPTLQMAQKPETSAPAEHDFCPCCLFTNSIDAFDELHERTRLSTASGCSSSRDCGRATSKPIAA